jgi:hypothetical protein
MAHLFEEPEPVAPGLDDASIALRNRTYSLFVDLGRAPAVDEVALEMGLEEDDVRRGWRRLHDAHALVLHRDSDELRMANPFAAAPTAHRVLASGRWWYANCAWDALGIGAALHCDAHVETSCADCGEPISLDVRDEEPSDQTLLFHCLVPAAHWWDDIGFT